MSFIRHNWCCFALLLTWPMAQAAAAELVSPDRPVPEVVDHYIEARLAEKHVAAASQADDANLIRRTTLDLVGRIPTLAEVEDYLADTDSHKRVKLVDRLMSSPEFQAHQINEFDALLMYGTSGNLRDYLSQAIKERRGWDRVFSDLMNGRDDVTQAKGSDQFLKARVKDSDRLTNDVSTLFFGVNISCTQCHDHPLVPEWRQDHFYGLKSFFNRSFENGGFVAERDYGIVSYKTPKGEDRTASLMFLSGTKLDEPEAAEPTNDAKKAETKLLKELADKKTPPPEPKFSRRALLIDVALRPNERRFFARSIVNRLWYRLLGYGLVMPIDQMHQENAPSHPQLLDWLERDLVEHGYDLQRVIRGLVLSQAYSRSSRWEAGPRPGAELFAVAEVRPLPPFALAASLKIATANPTQFDQPNKPDDISRRVAGLVNASRSLASMFDMPEGNFQVSTTEPLFFSNSDKVVNEFLADGNDRLIGRLKELSEVDEQVKLAVWAVMSRAPTDGELKILGDYVRRRSDRPVDALRQIVWALVSSAEFRFNY